MIKKIINLLQSYPHSLSWNSNTINMSHFKQILRIADWVQKFYFATKSGKSPMPLLLYQVSSETQDVRAAKWNQVITGVELSGFHVLQYINLLLSPLSSQPTQMDCVSVRTQLPWHGRSKAVIIGFILLTCRVMLIFYANPLYGMLTVRAWVVLKILKSR